MFLFCALSLYSEKIGSFPDIRQPSRIYIQNDELYVVDGGRKISVYSIPDQKFLREISKNGEGPGEYRFSPILKITPEQIFFGALNKILLFSRTGSDSV